MSLIRRAYSVATRAVVKRHGLDALNAALLVLPRWMIRSELNAYGATIGDRTTICGGLQLANIESARNLEHLVIGRHCYVGPGVMFDLTGRVILEDEVSLAPRVTILTHSDVGLRPLAAVYPSWKRDTVLRYGCWVGACATVLGGVTVGSESVVAAGSLVRDDVPARNVVAGVPARHVRTLPEFD